MLKLARVAVLGCLAGSTSSDRSSSSCISCFDGGEEESNVALDVAELGAADCTLIGHNWSIPVHRCLTTLPTESDEVTF